MAEQKLTEKDFQALEEIKMAAITIDLLASDPDSDLVNGQNTDDVVKAATRTIMRAHDHLYGKLVEMPQE